MSPLRLAQIRRARAMTRKDLDAFRTLRRAGVSDETLAGLFQIGKWDVARLAKRTEGLVILGPMPLEIP